MSRATILEAVLDVLSREHAPLSAAEIRDRVVARSLFPFKTKDTLGVVRAAIRRHLRTHGGAGQTAARLRRVSDDQFAISLSSTGSDEPR